VSRIQYYCATSLDGFIAEADDTLEWLTGYQGTYDVRFAQGAVRDLHASMLDAAGERNLWVVGGGNVASQFADAGLLDEVIATVVPVVLGKGKPLFDRRLQGGPMQLTGTRAFDSGMAELRYEISRD
jgi:dihydrofolate reductase